MCFTSIILVNLTGKCVNRFLNYLHKTDGETEAQTRENLPQSHTSIPAESHWIPKNP